MEAIHQGKALEALTLAHLQKFSMIIGDDRIPDPDVTILSGQACPAKGEVALQQVAAAIVATKQRLV